MTTVTVPALLKIKEAAQTLGMSEWLLRKLAREGEVKFIQRVPKAPMLFDPADLAAWVRKNKQ